MQNPISRRSALKLPAAIAAALTLGAVIPEQADAQARAVILGDPTTNAAYISRFAEWNRKNEAALDKNAALHSDVMAQAGPDLTLLIERYAQASADLLWLDHQRTWDLIEYHAPGLAPLLRLLHEHVSQLDYGAEANCCHRA